MVDIDRRTSSNEDIYLRYVIRDVVGDSHSVQFESRINWDVKERIVPSRISSVEGGRGPILFITSIHYILHRVRPHLGTQIALSCGQGLG